MDEPNIEVVKINDLTDNATLAHLLKYDTVHGKFQGTVTSDETSITVNGKRIIGSSEKDPLKLGWGELGVDVVVESTGVFSSQEKALMHVQAGARKVLITAPAKGDVDATVVLGVNDGILRKDHIVISNASCTTNCLAPMVKVLDEQFGIVSGFMTTIHAYTGDQNLVDAPHRDLRRARAAAMNIVPTSTGAAKALGLVLPQVKGLLDGFAARVPVPDGSLTDFTAILRKPATKDEINAAFQAASQGSLKGYLEYSEEEIVSSDIIGSSYSCIFDSKLTNVQGALAKVVGWYDNEYGYSCRVVELISRIA
jgi:glyceraldehyde 3-phosphate dehydrogenase